MTERNMLTYDGLLHYETETVGARYTANGPVTLSYVLNVPPSEDGWLAHATELFVPEFAERLVGDSMFRAEHELVTNHMMNELFRQSCSPAQVTLESIWQSEHMLYCFERDCSYEQELFGDPFADPFASERFGDGSDDEQEDTLDSELLLTEVYHAPDSVSDKPPLARNAGLNLSNPLSRRVK